MLSGAFFFRYSAIFFSFAGRFFSWPKFFFFAISSEFKKNILRPEKKIACYLQIFFPIRNHFFRRWLCNVASANIVTLRLTEVEQAKKVVLFDGTEEIRPPVREATPLNVLPA